MTHEELKDLQDRYRKGQTSEAENQLLDAWCNDLYNSTPQDFPIDREKLERDMWAAISPEPIVRKLPVYHRYAIAAVVAFVIITTGIVYFNNNTQTANQNPTAKEIQPGGNKATLTLANGKTITLTTDSVLLAARNAASGVIVSNNTHTGIVTFTFGGNSGRGVDPKNKKEDDEVQAAPNTISTPAGGQYHLVLSDGTHVYLNAASKIQFPSRFAGKTRTVSVQGEAYFQVAKDPKHPFVVTSKGQTLTVLGTHFNISAYPGEPVTTTLAEGSVELSCFSLKNQRLKPDQQAVLLSDGFNVKHVSSLQVIAWKDGVFNFYETPLNEALRQISRWYDVDVNYKDLPDTAVDARLPRTRSLAEVLSLLTAAGYPVKYSVKERRIEFVR